MNLETAPMVVPRCWSLRQRPKVEEHGDSPFVVMQWLDFVGGEPRVGEVALFAGANDVPSVRSASRQHFLGVRERAGRPMCLADRGSD
jgi:magnesium transporter